MARFTATSGIRGSGCKIAMDDIINWQSSWPGRTAGARAGHLFRFQPLRDRLLPPHPLSSVRPFPCRLPLLLPPPPPPQGLQKWLSSPQCAEASQQAGLTWPSGHDPAWWPMAADPCPESSSFAKHQIPDRAKLQQNSPASCRVYVNPNTRTHIKNNLNGMFEDLRTVQHPGEGPEPRFVGACPA